MMLNLYYVYYKNNRGKWVVHGKFSSEEVARLIARALSSDGLETRVVRKGVLEHVFRQSLKFVLTLVGLAVGYLWDFVYSAIERL